MLDENEDILNFEKENLNIILVENDELNDIFGELIYKIYLKDFELEFQIDKNHIITLINILKYSSLFLYKIFIDLTIVDNPTKLYRFILFYQLTSDIYPNRCRIVTQTDEYISSVIKIFPNACWIEREAWDMFGVFFSLNYDLRRILTDYGFEDFPLQKTFKLTGNYEISYNESVKRVIYQNINENQRFKEFVFLNPWGSYQLKMEDE